MLTDPRTGREIAEVQGMDKKAEPPSGTLHFAGDPACAGVIRTTRNGEPAISIVGNVRLGNPEAVQDIAKKARDLTQVLVPGRPPAVRFFDPPQNYVKHLGPWLADHPDKPRKPNS
jgi:hypothetical protein